MWKGRSPKRPFCILGGQKSPPGGGLTIGIWEGDGAIEKVARETGLQPAASAVTGCNNVNSIKRL